jgi:anti-anti-sigma factor
MDIQQTTINGITIFEFIGHLDTITAPEAEQAINAAIHAGNTAILINLHQTSYISSSGLRVLLATAKRLKGIGELRISNLNKNVQNVFDISGFTSILDIDATQEEAVNRFTGIHS